jgi:hypothetical protein
LYIWPLAPCNRAELPFTLSLTWYRARLLSSIALDPAVTAAGLPLASHNRPVDPTWSHAPPALRSALPASAHLVCLTWPGLLQVRPPAPAHRRRSSRRPAVVDPAASPPSQIQPPARHRRSSCWLVYRTPSSPEPTRPTAAPVGLPRRSGRPRAIRRPTRPRLPSAVILACLVDPATRL